MGTIFSVFNAAKKNKLFISKNVNRNGYILTSQAPIIPPTPPEGTLNIYDQGNTFVPSVVNSVGSDGQIGSDGNYFYVCVGSNNWSRVAFSSW